MGTRFHYDNDNEVPRLQWMIIGRIRWPKRLGVPLGDLSGGFSVLVEEHTPSHYQVGSGGIDVDPDSARWQTVADAITCSAAPDEGERHVVEFTVPGLHKTMPFDGKYRVTPTLSGEWSEAAVQSRVGFRRIEPRYQEVPLTDEQPVRSLDFEVIHNPWTPRRIE